MPGNLYRRGKTWWGRVRVAGSELRRSLRTSDRAEARKRLDAWLGEINHARYHGEARLTWKAAVTRYVAEISHGIKPSTLLRYQCSLRQVEPILNGMYVDEITRKTIARIVGSGLRRKATNATNKRDLTAVSRVLASCVMHGEIEENPAKTFDKEMLRERRAPRRLPPENEVKRLIAEAPGNLGRLALWLRQTGMRLEEAAGLERPQVRVGAKVADLHETKTDTARAVPLSPEAMRTYLGTVQFIGSPWVFWHSEGERYNRASNQFAAIRRRLGFKWTIHDLRHLFAVTYLRERRGSIYDLQKILGHASIRTTEIYLDYLTPAEQEAAKSAHKSGHRV